MRKFSKPNASGPSTFEPFWSSPGGAVKVWQGNVTEVLARMPARSVQCVVTSPPYFGLRDYGTGTWEGGDPNCDHKQIERKRGSSKTYLAGNGKPGGCLSWQGSSRHDESAVTKCTCGAVRVNDAQLGSEPSPDCGTQGKARCGKCFVCNMVAVFRGVRRVLRDDGVLWLNLGSSYAGGKTGRDDNDAATRAAMDAHGHGGGVKLQTTGNNGQPRPLPVGYKSGDLVATPWLAALALQADGWVLRSDVPWVKRSPLPEPVTNRPAKSLEYVFLLTKGMNYFYDAEAVRQKAVYGFRKWGEATATEHYKRAVGDLNNNPLRNSKPHLFDDIAAGRNFRQTDLWYQSVESPFGMVGAGDELVGLDVTSQGYPGAHFATFPEGLVKPLILAGTSACGACATCGAPWERVSKSTRADARVAGGGNCIGKQGVPAAGTGAQQEGNYRQVLARNTLGWRPRCGCRAGIVPCVVFDPFLGSGTTIATAVKHGRHGWGIDLSETYIRENAVPRIEEALAGEKSGEACARLPALEAKAPAKVDL